MSDVKNKKNPDILSVLKQQCRRLFLGRLSHPELILVVSLSSDTLKIAHARKLQGNFIIEGLAVEDISKKTDVEMVQAVLRYCQSRKVNPTQSLGLLSSKQFIFKGVDVPSTEKEEVSKIIDLQAGRFTPYAREEIVIDFICLESLVQYFTNVLLFIVNRKITDRLTFVFREAHLEVDKITIAADSMAMIYNQSLGNTPLQGALGGLLIGEDYSELTVIDAKQVVFVRNIPVGAVALTKNPVQAQNDFLQEFKRSIIADHDQGVGKPVQRLLLTGFTENVGPLEQELNRNGTKIEVAHFDYRKSFDANEAVMAAVHQYDQFSFFEIFSVLTHTNQTKVNLLPPELKLRRRVREMSREILTLGILIMSIFLLSSLIMGSKVYFRGLVNQKLEAMSRKYGDEAKHLETVSTKNRIVKKLIESRGKELTVLNVINGFIGDDLYLSQINYDNEGHVSIAGTAASMSRVFSFVTQLMQSNYFSKVETKETKSRKEGKQDVADFIIECVLAKGF